MSDAERLRRSRSRRPRTETLHRALAQVLLRGVSEGWISESDARAELMIELEGVWVGPSKRHLTKREREELADRLLGGQ